MDLGIAGRIAVITGAASDIGRATAVILAGQGARVALVDSDEVKLDAAAKALQAKGEIIAAHADLADTAHVQRLRKTIAERLGEADILVHAAAAVAPARAFTTLTDDDWREALDNGLLVAVRLCRAVIPPMQANGWGRIVLLASEADALPTFAVDAAILGLVKVLARTHASEGVRISAVSTASTGPEKIVALCAA